MSASDLPLPPDEIDQAETEQDETSPQNSPPSKTVRKVAPLSFEQRAFPPPVLLMVDVAGLLGLPSEEAAGKFLNKHGIPRAFLAGRNYVITDSLLSRIKELEVAPPSEEEVQRRAEEDLAKIAPTARSRRKGLKPLSRRKQSA